jgi:erythromycin esterase-like protein/predicted phosphoribosyltransferase
MEPRRLQNRREAGRLLAEHLRGYAGRDDVIVLALPRGGVPVADEIAQTLAAPLDVYLVRKLGVPGHEELAFGAIATGGIRVINRHLVDALELTVDQVEAVAARELTELERRERDYRDARPPPSLTGKTAILVDDGLATGSTMWAAVLATRQEDPARIVVAVPVADPQVCASFRDEADEVVCLMTPERLGSVGRWYEDFEQTSDEEVRNLLARARRPPPRHRPERLVALEDAHERLLERARGARFVLVGEASHGTHEFYRERAELTKRLIADGRCAAVALEADWPDAYRVNRYVRGLGDDASAEAALSGFRRFPVWMWRNTVVAEFVAWLREHNDGLARDADKVGFYGLDLYSLYTSMDEVVRYLEQIDRPAAQRARERYACFDHYGREPHIYAYEAGIGGAESCEQQAVEQLLELRAAAVEAALADALDPERQFYAEMNAELVIDAEAHYRAVFRGGQESWNLRDRHMVRALDALTKHLGRGRAEPVRAVVWAHNSHVGDARATDMGQAGQVNVGGLVRERFGAGKTFIVGFTTFTGTVTAASAWGGEAERKRLRRALPGSWEDLLHAQGEHAFLIDATELEGRSLERAIGVVYRPETERLSHYFHARISEQFDAVIHIDETEGVESLERSSEWLHGELPQTYPWGV